MLDFALPIAAPGWDHPVELIRLGANLSVTRSAMPLAEAVAAFLALAPDQQPAAGIALHSPVLTTINERPVALGWLNAASIFRLVADRAELNS